MFEGEVEMVSIYLVLERAIRDLISLASLGTTG